MMFGRRAGIAPSATDEVAASDVKRKLLRVKIGTDKLQIRGKAGALDPNKNADGKWAGGRLRTDLFRLCREQAHRTTKLRHRATTEEGCELCEVIHRLN